MKKIMLPVVVVLIAALAGGWFYWQGQRDGFDYEQVFERGADGAAGEGNALIDLKAIAGRDPRAVRDALGEPQRCEPAEFSERCRYGSTEITYIDGKADWITVALGGETHPLLPETLAVLGLPVRDADEVNDNEYIWHELAGYREVRLAGTEQGAIYARIKVAAR